MTVPSARPRLASVRWYPRDWRASTTWTALSPLERGIFRELCDAHYDSDDCTIPEDDDVRLAAMAGLRVGEWMKVKAAVLRWIPVVAPGKRQHPRCLKEWTAAMHRRDTAAENGANGGRPPKRTETNGFPSGIPRVNCAGAGSAPPSAERAPSEHSPLPPVAQAWNEVAEPAGLPLVTAMNARRAKHLAARLKEEPDVSVWRRAFEAIVADDWNLGRNDRKWVASFDYAISPEKSGRWLDIARGGGGFALATLAHRPPTGRLTPRQIAEMAREETA